MTVPLSRLWVAGCVLSLMAVGGANAVIPEIQRHVVDVDHWMTGAEFAALFAISQAAPGPNVLIVSLVGYRVAGLAGALVATLAMCGPSSLLAFAAAKLWRRLDAWRGRRVVERALAPVAVGLVFSSGWLLARGADAGWPGYVLTATATGLGAISRLNPLWLLAGGAVVGLLANM